MRNDRLGQALDRARAHLLACSGDSGFWIGHLSSSALAAATALGALSLAGDGGDDVRRRDAVRWLVANRNADGGWGDTPASPTNLPTTVLVAAGLRLAGQAWPDGLAACLETLAGPAGLNAALERAYGEDHTFSVPIRMMAAAAGLLPWGPVPGLPFELAVVPRRLMPVLRLDVVSYALPALIGVGIGVHAHAARRGSGWHLRELAVPSALRRLGKLQPQDGGFLEAVPLTAFVAMGLVVASHAGHPVVEAGVRFLRSTQRDDGSWPIDTNLAVWLTTGAVQALAAGGLPAGLNVDDLERWILGRQYHAIHPYTGAAAGGWGWTHLPGGVPDADDTAGALLALRALRGPATPADTAVRDGCRWLIDLQNRDGGWPTFCRGWGRLPFDRSAPDITAHALRALAAWPDADRRSAAARQRGLAWLDRTQAAEGYWTPLWFGNQYASQHGNPVYGTSRVLAGLADSAAAQGMVDRGVAWLLGAQGPEGGWGGAPGVAPSVEETALAVIGLAPWCRHDGVAAALGRARDWLVARVEDGTWTKPTPIGLYFSSLWYDESVYPVMWSAEALARLAEVQ